METGWSAVEHRRRARFHTPKPRQAARQAGSQATPGPVTSLQKAETDQTFAFRVLTPSNHHFSPLHQHSNNPRVCPRDAVIWLAAHSYRPSDSLRVYAPSSAVVVAITTVASVVTTKHPLIPIHAV